MLAFASSADMVPAAAGGLGALGDVARGAALAPALDETPDSWVEADGDVDRAADDKGMTDGEVVAAGVPPGALFFHAQLPAGLARGMGGGGEAAAFCWNIAMRSLRLPPPLLMLSLASEADISPTLTAEGDEGIDAVLPGDGAGLSVEDAMGLDGVVLEAWLGMSLVTTVGEVVISSAGGLLVRMDSGASVCEVGTEGAGVVIGTEVSMGEG